MRDGKIAADRRTMMAAVGTALVALGLAPAARAATARRAGCRFDPPVGPPPALNVTERLVDAAGARLYVQDHGKAGAPAILLAHPVTGSARVWGYQQAAFAAAGYRTVAWSRRGHNGTEILPGGSAQGTMADIDAVADALGLDRFHAVGSAGGGGTMLEYAIARPRRVRSLVVACSLGNIADPDLQRRSGALRPAPFDDLPADARELGPAYRAADPAGAARWKALEESARTIPMARPGPGGGGGGGAGRGRQWAEVAALPMPVLWLTGGADMFTPPPLLAEYQRRLPGSEMAVIDNAGHSAYWEQPAEFNRIVLDFLKRRARG